MSSFHIEAKPNEIAETVLLPGDPLRAKFVAENLLENAICYNRVRNMFGYTGYYKGKRISIQGTGMGMGSSAIYINELITTYKVKNLIRVGTCGGLQKDQQLGQVILVMSASGDSGANNLYFNGYQYAATSDFDLLYKAYNIAESLGIKTTVGPVFSTETFYDDIPNRWEKWINHGILGAEMESQILLTLAKRLGAKAMSILTVSDNIITGASASSQEREQGYMDMMKIALEVG